MKTMVAVALAMVLSAFCVVQAEEANTAGEVTLKGKIGCAACNYGVASKCAVAFKTADGKVYTLTNASKELMEARHEDGTLQVTGKVTEKDGKLFIEASKAELVK